MKLEEVLTKKFYNRNPQLVAQELLGKLIVRKLNKTILVGKVVETEAYLSSGDSAAHNFKGQTNRNKSLYKNAGHLYVHSMRQWHLVDIVTEGVGVPSSVLIRAVEPLEGVEQMKKFRKTEDLLNLTSGPSKFCQAFSISKELDGVDITESDSELFLITNKNISSKEISTSGRVGISRAKDMPLRFWITDNPYISR